MAKYTAICPVCKKEFVSYDASPNMFCSVGCQYDEPYNYDRIEAISSGPNSDSRMESGTLIIDSKKREEMNRADRRAVAKRRRQKDPQQIAIDKLGLFDKLPKSCDVCQKSFDKSSRNMVFSWNVVVKEETVRLFCPECMEKAKIIIEDFKGEKNES